MAVLLGHKLGLIQPFFFLFDEEYNNHSSKQIESLKDFYFSLDLGLVRYQDSNSVKESY